ncbi:MAG: LapA family protein [Desulfohalobiaceae bacterium]|nr:LapA family protein [Desulfohalobiaceae bacterium]
MRYVKALLVILLFVFGLTFFLQNSEMFTATLSVRFEVLDWGGRSDPIPLYMFLVLAFLLGALISLLYLAADKIKLHRELKRRKSRISSLERELSSLRNMSLDKEQHQEESP